MQEQVKGDTSRSKTSPTLSRILMKIRNIINDLYAFMQTIRRSGTTTLLKDIALRNDVYILVPDEESKKEFGDNAITFNELYFYDSLKSKPILLDNYTLIKLTELTNNEFDKLDLKIKNYKDLVESIKDSIDLFERKNKR